MADKLRVILLAGMGMLILLPGCKHNLDVGGVISTESSVNERFEQSIQWNAENERRISGTYGQEYQVILAGDPHVGGIENLETLIDAAHDSMALALVLAGDVCTGKPEDYRRLDSVLSRSTIVPNCLVVGNHDLYFDGWNSFYNYFGSSTYTMDILTPGAQDLYIFLDSGGGTLGSLQLEWLRELLEDHRNEYRHVIVISHCNFFRNRMTGSTVPLNEELIVLLDLFERHRVDMQIYGHDHDRYIEEFGNTTYITLDAMVDGVEQASYLVLTVNADGLNYTFVEF